MRHQGIHRGSMRRVDKGLGVQWGSMNSGIEYDPI
ncbi:hypothetical protein T08_13216 [Trichinella sp. T8]|nr:hypothetical protein T08_13216 [Trichinella sp. T8]